MEQGKAVPLFSVGACSFKTEGRIAAPSLRSYPNQPIRLPYANSPSTQYQFFGLKSRRLAVSNRKHEQVEPLK